MAGVGFPPDPTRKARSGSPKPRQVALKRGKQPPLPPDIDWHPVTLKWWSTWKNDPLAADFTESEWMFLVDTAMIHTRFWNSGEPKYASELRQRAAKFGVTPEDRARLRIVYSDANEKESRTQTSPKVEPSAQEKYSGLRAV